MNKSSGIYRITNIISGKVYVGSAVNIQDRWYRHKLHLRNGAHNCAPLQSSWNKHGERAFEFSILETVEDASNLLDREQFYLDSIRPFDRDVGYNCCQKAYSTLGIKYTSEAKAKLSASTKKAHDNGCYDRKNERQIGTRLSEEHRGKITASLEAIKKSGYVHSKERNAKISASRTGKKYPALSVALKASAASRKAKAEATTI